VAAVSQLGASTTMSEPSKVISKSIGKVLDSALDAGAGLLRLTPTWVPRSFLHPGKRIKLAPEDWYALGADRGGFHTYFADPKGGPIHPKADWVEFRLWRTYGTRSGQTAKTAMASGWAAGIELEVYGAPGDVLKLSPLQIARREAMRKALDAAGRLPPQPPQEKKATWQETIQASREAILQWEIALDRALLDAWGAELGGWHAIGPDKADSPVARQIERDRATAPDRPVALKGAKSVSWRPVGALADGKMAAMVRGRDLFLGQ